MGCPSDMSSCRCPGTSLPCREAPAPSCHHDGLRGQYGLGKADLLSPEHVGQIKTGLQQGTATGQENQKLKATPANSWHAAGSAAGHGLGHLGPGPLGAFSPRPTGLYAKIPAQGSLLTLRAESPSLAFPPT